MPCPPTVRARCLLLALPLMIHIVIPLQPAAAVSAPPALPPAENHTLPFRDFHTFPCCICFALDESSSVSNETWTQQTNLVLGLIQLHHQFNEGRARYAVVSFAVEPGSRLIVGLTSGVIQVAMLVRNHSRRGGGTDLGAGLVECQRALFSVPAGQCEGRTIVVVTDGFGLVPEGVLKDVKESGVGVVTVGVGESVLLSQLERVASEPEWAFHVSMEAMERVHSVPEDMSWKRRWTPPVLVRIASRFCRRRVPYFDFLSRT